MDVRLIFEDIKFCYFVKILLLTNIAFAIAFSKTCVIYLYVFFVSVLLKRINKFTAAFTPKLKHVLMT